MDEPTKGNRYSAEFKTQFVLNGLSSHRGVAGACRESQISESVYYRWRKQFIETGKTAFHNCGRARNRSVLRKPLIAHMSESGTEERLRFVRFLQSRNRSALHLPAEVKLQVLDIVEKSELSKRAVLKAIAIPRTSYYRWKKNFSFHHLV